MNPLKFEPIYDKDGWMIKPYFHCTVVIGHMLPDNDWEKDWGSELGDPGERIANCLRWAKDNGKEAWNTSAVAGIWRFPDNRSVANAIVQIAKDPFVLVKLPKSGMEIRKQIQRLDLLQHFGPDDRGIFEVTVGSHWFTFIVGWPTEEAATKALSELHILDFYDGAGQLWENTSAWTQEIAMGQQCVKYDDKVRCPNPVYERSQCFRHLELERKAIERHDHIYAEMRRELTKESK
jgi:hypothetical protein